MLCLRLPLKILLGGGRRSNVSFSTNQNGFDEFCVYQLLVLSQKTVEGSLSPTDFGFKMNLLWHGSIYAKFSHKFIFCAQLFLDTRYTQKRLPEVDVSP